MVRTMRDPLHRAQTRVANVSAIGFRLETGLG
jgi:hypothetical protein